jgi:hypothetical protein
MRIQLASKANSPSGSFGNLPAFVKLISAEPTSLSIFEIALDLS